MNSKVASLCGLFTLFIYESSLAQEKPDLTMYQKRLIDKIELVTGLGLFLPNDHGYSEYIKNTSQGTETFETQKKVGYSIGLGLIRSVSKHFELRGRILFEGKGYVQTDVSIYTDVKMFVDDFSNNYVTYSILPTILLDRNKLNVFAGVFYSQLTKSTFVSTEYLNGQIQSSHLLTGVVASYESGIVGGFGYAIYTMFTLSKSLKTNRT